MKRFWAALRTTAVRLSALYLLLFSVCALLLVVYMTGVAARFVITETRTNISAEITTLDRIYQRGGMRVLIREVQRRSTAPGAKLYIVTDSVGRILAGNVLALEPGVINEIGWSDEPFRYSRFGDESDDLRKKGEGPRAVAQIVDLPNGMRLLVGQDIGEPERFREVVRRALSLALAMMGLGALLIWFFVGRRALKRIDQMSLASSRIMAGDLTGRLPVSPANDEFDRLSDSLNIMLSRISLLNDGLRDVSDSIAHDLKTPLTRLRNKAAQALDGKHDRPAMEQAITDIMGEADQLIRIFNALLLISRVESGYSKQQMEPVNVSAIAQDMAELFEPTAEDAGFVFRTDIADGLTVSGNRELIGQALTNLIENALKYGKPDDDRPGTIWMQARPPSKQAGAQLIVSDNGQGINPSDRQRVLERFVRLDESRSQSGSGLGLSLVEAIMALHGGTIALEDAAPGLRIVLTFPAANG